MEGGSLEDSRRLSLEEASARHRGAEVELHSGRSVGPGVLM